MRSAAHHPERAPPAVLAPCLDRVTGLQAADRTARVRHHHAQGEHSNASRPRPAPALSVLPAGTGSKDRPVRRRAQNDRGNGPQSARAAGRRGQPGHSRSSGRMRRNQISPGSCPNLDAALKPRPEMSRFQPAAVAIVVTATALAAIAMGFGICATLTMNPVLLQREAALAGIYSLVLATLTAALAVSAWALRGGRET